MSFVLYNVLELKSISACEKRGVRMKKCAVINDISGFGKCSLGAQLPILAALGIQAHPAPTAVLSNQSAYDSYYRQDMTDFLAPCFAEWKKLSADFDAVLTGYFASARAVETVIGFLEGTDALLVVDPVMGDNGCLYDGFDGDMCNQVKRLACLADVITPNATELKLLTGESDAEKAARIMLGMGNKAVVLTGVEQGEKIGSTVYTQNGCETFSAPKRGGYFSGTGDIFTAVLTGMLLKGKSVFDAARCAGDFVSSAISETDSNNAQDGVDFEKRLRDLYDE